MRGVPDVRQANRDWGNRTPVLRFIPDQDRLNLIGLSPAEVGRQLQFLLTGIPITQVREDIRNVPIVARSAGGERLDPTRLAEFSLMSRDGRQIPLDQIGHSEMHLEEPILKRRDRTPVITIRSDINEATQPPEVSKQIMTALQPLMASLPVGYRIELGGSIEEAAKANAALGQGLPGHDRRHANRHDVAGAILPDDDHGAADGTAWPCRRRADVADLQSALRV